jgi:hypothetical protein
VRYKDFHDAPYPNSPIYAACSHDCTITLFGLMTTCSGDSSGPAPTYALGGTVSDTRIV